VRARRAVDKEVGWDEIAEAEKPAYREAIEAHWNEWRKYESVRILSQKETEAVRRTVGKERILRSRFALRNKHAGTDKPLKAKARLVIAGQNCPDSAAGLLKTDAPTVQRVAVLLLLQVAASYGWLESLGSGTSVVHSYKDDLGRWKIHCSWNSLGTSNWPVPSHRTACCR